MSEDKIKKIEEIVDETFEFAIDSPEEDKAGIFEHGLFLISEIVEEETSEEQMSPKLEKAIEEAERDRKAGKNISEPLTEKELDKLFLK